MPTYTYRAKNLKGEELRGSYHAISENQVKEMLGEKGYFLVDAQTSSKQLSFEGILGRVGSKDLSVFCRQFSVILDAGITIIEAVSILEEQCENKRLKKVLGSILEEIQKGRLLSDTMERNNDVFPEFMISMVKVGELSGQLNHIMDQLANYYEKDNKMKGKVKTAMTYPAILATMTVGVVLILLIKVLPMFVDTLAQFGGELPLITKVMMTASAFLVNNFFLLLILVLIAILGFVYYSKSDTGGYMIDKIKLQVPIIKTLTVKLITSRFARSMGILLKSGVPVINAIEIMSNMVGNKVATVHFKSCINEIEGGKGLAEPLKTMNIFPPLLIHMVAVGEKTGELDDLLNRTAGFFDEEVEESIQKLTTMIEPIMLVIMAVVVGTIVVAVLMPMLSIMDAIQ